MIKEIYLEKLKKKFMAFPYKYGKIKNSDIQNG